MGFATRPGKPATAAATCKVLEGVARAGGQRQRTVALSVLVGVAAFTLGWSGPTVLAQLGSMTGVGPALMSGSGGLMALGPMLEAPSGPAPPCQGQTPSRIIIDRIVAYPADGASVSVTLRNVGGQDANLTGWRLADSDTRSVDAAQVCGLLSKKGKQWEQTVIQECIPCLV
jgi:hypothetical protein